MAEQEDSRYIFEKSCPYCYVSDAERMKRSIAERETAIVRATTPLPGSEPYYNYLPLRISAKYAGYTLIDMLCAVFPQYAREHWLDRFEQRRLLNRDRLPVAADQLVQAGDVYLHRMPIDSEPDVSVAIRILHEDDAIVVLNKPAPLALHPSGRFNRNTLQWILNEVYYPHKLRPVHRLDANTTGIVVFARTRQVAGMLQPQFAAAKIEKCYLARIAGHPNDSSFVCEASIGSSAIEAGGRAIDEQGLDARTEFRVLLRYDDGTSLVEAKPITGRTNQIRVHLWHLGLPIVGDQMYLANQRIGKTQTHAASDPPLCLHAHRISFDHPLTGIRTAFECVAPAWAEKTFRKSIQSLERAYAREV